MPDKRSWHSGHGHGSRRPDRREDHGGDSEYTYEYLEDEESEQEDEPRQMRPAPPRRTGTEAAYGWVIPAPYASAGGPCGGGSMHGAAGAASSSTKGEEGKEGEKEEGGLQEGAQVREGQKGPSR